MVGGGVGLTGGFDGVVAASGFGGAGVALAVAGAGGGTAGLTTDAGLSGKDALMDEHVEGGFVATEPKLFVRSWTDPILTGWKP